MQSKLILSITDAQIKYNNLPIFKNLNINLHKQSRIALVGKNGCGKTTLMKVISGVLELEEGERWIENGIKIGYLNQEFLNINNKTVSEEVLSSMTKKSDSNEKYKVDIITNSLNLDTNIKLSNLSGGQLRKVGLAKSLINEPDILLLDEPTNHLDLEMIEWLENYLKQYNGTIICVSHDRLFYLISVIKFFG